MSSLIGARSFTRETYFRSHPMLMHALAAPLLRTLTPRAESNCYPQSTADLHTTLGQKVSDMQR
jgi:hypothetical protein